MDNSNSLFDYGSGQDTSYWTHLDLPTPPDLDHPSAEQREDARTQCLQRGVVSEPWLGACITDVAVTSDASLAWSSGTSAVAALSSARFSEVPCPITTPVTSLSAAAEGIPSAGLKLWLRADTGVVLDAQDKVCGWLDQSGHHHDLFNETAQHRPAPLATVNGKPALSFAENQQLHRRDVLGISAQAGRTMIEVIQLHRPEGRVALYQGKEGDNGIWIGLDDNTYGTRGELTGCYVTHNSFDGDIKTTKDPTLRVFSIDSMEPGLMLPAPMTCRTNGTNMTMSIAAANGGAKVLDFSAANMTQVATTDTGNAGIAELLIYDHRLSQAELDAVESMLAKRYALQLSP